MVALRVSDADRNGTMRRLHNAVALGLIDIGEFEQRSSLVSYARTRSELDEVVGDPHRVELGRLDRLGHAHDAVACRRGAPLGEVKADVHLLNQALA